MHFFATLRIAAEAQLALSYMLGVELLESAY